MPLDDVRTISLGRLSTRPGPGRLSATGPLDAVTIDRGLDDWYVPTHDRAKTRCIDGRRDPALDEALLGP